MPRTSDLAALDRYTAASEAASSMIIAAYSTSFGIATRMLGTRHRRHVRNIYALVRVADELVDGVAEEAQMVPAEQRRKISELEEETEQAMQTGYSSNPIVHAFALTARSAGIDAELTRPFFDSMRMDLPSHTDGDRAACEKDPGRVHAFDASEHAAYVYGSAEVVGLMCLRVFVRDEQYSGDDMLCLEHGAKQLGAAFQNINFLRDLGDDAERLGRDYLGSRELTPELQARWIRTIRSQLSDAEAALPLLPADARGAVCCALKLFERLTDRIEQTPAAQLRHRRVRVPGPVKAWLALRSMISMRKAGAA